MTVLCSYHSGCRSGFPVSFSERKGKKIPPLFQQTNYSLCYLFYRICRFCAFLGDFNTQFHIAKTQIQQYAGPSSQRIKLPLVFNFKTVCIATFAAE